MSKFCIQAKKYNYIDDVENVFCPALFPIYFKKKPLFLQLFLLKIFQKNICSLNFTFFCFSRPSFGDMTPSCDNLAN